MINWPEELFGSLTKKIDKAIGLFQKFIYFKELKR
jgi:hypothetical protein